MFYLRDESGNELNLFDDLSNLFLGENRKGFMASDLSEDDKEYKLTIDVPGIDKKNIGISFNNHTLSISVKEDKADDEKKKNYIRRERYQANYQRSFYLVDGDESNIHAHLANGILEITVGKVSRVIENKNVISIE